MAINGVISYSDFSINGGADANEIADKVVSDLADGSINNELDSDSYPGNDKYSTSGASHDGGKSYSKNLANVDSLGRDKQNEDNRR